MKSIGLIILGLVLGMNAEASGRGSALAERNQTLQSELRSMSQFLTTQYFLTTPTARVTDCLRDYQAQEPTLTSNLDLHSSLFCFSQDPQKVNHLFTQSVDVDARFVNLWNQEFFEDQVAYADLSGENVPVQNYITLNRAAMVLWNKMVTCAGSEEQARLNYYSAKWNCDEDIAAHISTLHFNFIQLMGSSPVFLRNFNMPVESHPLLSQIYLELLIMWMTTDTLQGKQVARNRHVTQDENWEISKNFIGYSYLFSGAPGKPRGLWPSASAAAYVFASLKVHAMSNLIELPKTEYGAENPCGVFSGKQNSWKANFINPVWYGVRGICGMGHLLKGLAIKGIDLNREALIGFNTADSMVILPEIYTKEVHRIAKEFIKMSERYQVKEKDLFRRVFDVQTYWGY